MVAAVALLVLGLFVASWVFVMAAEFRLARLERVIDRFVWEVEEYCKRAAALDQWRRDDRDSS